MMTDTYNGEWQLPAFTAMCLWEEFLTAKEGTYPSLDLKRQNEGTMTLRDHIIGMVEDCDLAWIVAAANGYEWPFDWEFVPAFLALREEDPNLTPEAIGLRIVEMEKAKEAKK